MDDHQRVPLSPAVLPLFPKPVRPWWKRPVVAITVVLSAASFFIGGAIATSGNSSNAPSQPPQQQHSRVVQPTGLSYQQKQQILFRFCTSSKMSGPAGDSSAYPTCMGDYYVTDQGMVMPR